MIGERDREPDAEPTETETNSAVISLVTWGKRAILGTFFLACAVLVTSCCLCGCMDAPDGQMNSPGISNSSFDSSLSAEIHNALNGDRQAAKDFADTTEAMQMLVVSPEIHNTREVIDAMTRARKLLNHEHNDTLAAICDRGLEFLTPSHEFKSGEKERAAAEFGKLSAAFRGAAK